IAIITGIILIATSGCTKVDDKNNNDEEEFAGKNNQDTANSATTSRKPPELGMFVDDEVKNTLRPYSYCWNQNDCSIDRIDPEKVFENKVQSSDILSVKPGKQVQIDAINTVIYKGEFFSRIQLK